MGGVRTCIVFFVILTFVDFYHCGRGGGSRGGSRGGGSWGGGSRSYPSPSYHPAPSYHAPSYSPPSYHAPSYSPPSYHAPSYSPPSYHAPPAYSPSSSYRARPATSRPATSRPVTSRPVTSRPVTSRPVTSRPGTARPASVRPPVGPSPKPNYQHPGSSRRPVYVGSSPRPHVTSRPSLGFESLPPKPGNYPRGPSYGSGYSGPQKVKIVNKYNYHYPGYYSVPVAHYSHPGYFYTPSYYHYGSSDTGSTALGFFLGYGLAKMTTPTYSHYSFYDGYRPRYDHYTVHHYYHNADAVPQNQQIQANTIVGCVGDSVSICPVNTTSLCTSNGALMCVASATSTVPCSNNRQINCVTSTISCVNNTAPECKNAQQGNTTISIPCVSKANLYGDVKTVNNTIIAANATTIGVAPIADNTTNNTANNITTNTTTVTNNATISATNITTTNVNDTLITQYTQDAITTTPVPQISRKKRETPQDYCVTIVALPAKREPTEGEKFLGEAKFIAEKFIESAWNL